MERAVEAARPAIDAARQTLIVSTSGEPLRVDGDPVPLSTLPLTAPVARLGLSLRQSSEISSGSDGL